MFSSILSSKKYLNYFLRKLKHSRAVKALCLCLLLSVILFYSDTSNFDLVKRRREFITDITSELERKERDKDFDPKLPELRKRILRITKSNQFHSQFTNNDALYSNDINKRLFTDLGAGSLNVYTWTDLCSDDIGRMKGFISFPHNPLEKYLIHGLNSIESLDVSGKRIFGYISPPVSGSYSFQVIYYGSIEFWLSPDSLPVNAVLYQTSTPVVVSRLDKKILSEQVAKMSHFTVPLVAYKKQYIEIQHASRFGGLVEVKWKEKYSLEYIHIRPEFVFPYVHDFGDVVVPETYNLPILPLHAPSSGLIEAMHPPDERNNIFVLSSVGVSSEFPPCDYKPSYLEGNQARNANRISLTEPYPAITLQSLNVEPFILATVISQELMEKVLSIFKQQLVATNSTTRVSRLLNMERVPDEKNGDLFLVEVLVTYTEDQDPLKEHLISEYVVLGHKQHPPLVLCHPVDTNIRRDTFVHFLVTQRKFPRMIREFIQNMERVYEESRDENFGVIVMNYASPLINVVTLLRQSKLKHWSVIDFGGPWEKTAAINVGIDSVKNPDDIIFITDLSIHYPAHLIDTIRKHTFQGYSGFAPIVFYYNCEFTQGLHDGGHFIGLYSITGFGLFSMYKSDWIVVGGMDSSQFKGVWGFEDNDLANRVLNAGYVLLRLITRDFYHQNHTYTGLWDGKKY